MAQHEHARSFRELIVYRRAREAANDIYRLTTTFPKEERYSLTDQVRRSSRAVGAQIAEAWGKRRYPNHFVSKLTDADAEQLETQHWLDVASDCGLLGEDQHRLLVATLAEVGRMLNSMIAKADQFCGQPLETREAAELYGEDPPPPTQPPK